MKRLKRLAMAAALALALAACEDEGGDSGLGDDAYVPPATGDQPQLPAEGQPTGNSVLDGIVDDMIVELTIYQPMVDEIQLFWNEQYAIHGVPVTSDVAETQFLTGTEVAVCGSSIDTANSSAGPAYCQLTDVISMPTSMTTRLVNGEQITLQSGNVQVSPAGEVGVYFLLAHEWGHNVQNEIIGLEVLQQLPLVSIENNADCLAGVAIAGVPRVFEIKDAETILQLAIDIGQPPGGSHGTPQERFDAVILGMDRAYDNKDLINQGIIDCFMAYFPQLTQAAPAPADGMVTVPPAGNTPTSPAGSSNGQELLNDIQRKQNCYAVNWPDIEGCR